MKLGSWAKHLVQTAVVWQTVTETTACCMVGPLGNLGFKESIQPHIYRVLEHRIILHMGHESLAMELPIFTGDFPR